MYLQFEVLVNLAEVCLRSGRDVTQSMINHYVSSYLRHAPEKVGCLQYRLVYFILCGYCRITNAQC